MFLYISEQRFFPLQWLTAFTFLVPVNSFKVLIFLMRNLDIARSTSSQRTERSYVTFLNDYIL